MEYTKQSLIIGDWNKSHEMVLQRFQDHRSHTAWVPQLLPCYQASGEQSSSDYGMIVGPSAHIEPELQILDWTIVTHTAVTFTIPHMNLSSAAQVMS